MARYTNDELLALYAELIGDDNSSDDRLGLVVQELEGRGL